MHPRVFTWLPLPHLPRVPEHFVQRALAESLKHPVKDLQDDLMIKSGAVTTDYKFRTIVKDGQAQPTRCQEAFDLGEDWREWVRANITTNYLETSGRVSVAHNGATVHGAHADTNGRQQFYRLYYLVDSGGPDAESVFYVKPGCGAIFPMKEHKYNWCENIDELIEIDRTKFPEGQWILFNGFVLHGVEGVTGNRVNFNISVLPENIDFDVRFRIN